MATWVKPNGNKIVTNDEDHNIDKAIELGWELHVPVVEVPKKKQVRKAPKKR